MDLVKNMKNKLVKSFLEFSVGNIATLLLGLISSPIITRLILPDELENFLCLLL